MRKGDYIWLAIILSIVLLLIHPTSNIMYKSINTSNPYILGFIKFGFLATLGELLSLRIISGNWTFPTGLMYRSLIWGFIGIVIVLVFKIYTVGISDAISTNMLPGKEMPILIAFSISLIINLTFAPTMMAFHRITDTYIDMYYENKSIPVLKDVVAKIDWQGFVSFVICKTIPIFWIPAHTITFYLPKEYSVLMAAFLSIALGGILGFTKKRNVR